MKRVLVVCARFPPVNSPDMHRVRQSLPYFRAYGWESIVLAVDPRRCDAPLDPLLAETIPEGQRIIHSPALDARFTRPLGFGSLDLRALPFLACAGNRILARQRCDIVYFSTTAFTLFALGPYWLARYGIPYVLDLQDPWLSDYYDRPESPRPPGGRLKYRLSQRVARLLEPSTIRRASHIISVSPAYPDLLIRRYPWMSPSRFTVLPFGAPVADFELLSRRRVGHSVFDRADGRKHWVYIGAVASGMRFALKALFTALAAARREDPEAYADLRLHFVGTDYAAPDRARKSVEPVAVECGVADLVEERSERIPYFEALQCLLDADALVVPGSDDSGYTASKLFPYILAHRPLLAIFHERSSVVDVLRLTGAGTVVSFASGDAVREVAMRIRAAWLDRPAHEPPPTDWHAFEPYTAREMTRRQCAVFDEVLAPRAL